MPDLEDSTVDPPQGRRCSALTILHGTAVIILLSAIISCYVLVKGAIAPIVVQAVAYPAIACLYIVTSSSRKERIISCIFLGVLASPGIISASLDGSPPVPWVFGANIVALSVYCIWQLHPLIVQAWLRCVPAHALSCLSKKGNTILHGTTVIVLLLAILFCFVFATGAASIVVQAVAYPAIACLYIVTSSSRKERIISCIFLGVLAVLALPGIIAASIADSTPVPWGFGANIVALSAYCIWQLHPLIVQAWLRCVLAHATELATKQHLHGEQRGQVGRNVQQDTKFRIEGLPREYSYGEIQAMTKDFGSMVGRGGSAAVFRGLLDDGTAVAVKRIAVDQSSVGETEFLTEVTIVAGVQHRSLVRLLGYCLLRGGHRYLVYPFFKNRSLDSWLFTGEERRRHLPWPTRRRIAVDVARALAYLHHECRQQILHLDIKPANILLDGDLLAHVSDFGISMSIGRDLTSVDTRGRGTVGYMAPEMLIRALSAKSDVYSYGMTLFELVGGRRNFELADGASATPDFTRDFFPCVVRDRMAEGRLMEVVDATMALGAAGVDEEEVVDATTALGAAGVDEEEVSVVLKVALWCIQHNRDTRPSMPTVVEMLEGRIPVELPPESRVFVLNFSEPLSSSAAAVRDDPHT